MVRFSSWCLSSKPRPRHFARHCHLEAIKCPVRSSTSCRCSFRRSRSNRAFGPAKSELMRGRTLYWSGRKSLLLLDLPSPLPLLQHPSRGRNTDRRGPLAPRARVALKSFPRSSRSPLAAVGGAREGGGLLSVSLTSSRLGCKFSPRPLLTAILPLAPPFPSHAAVREFPRQSVHPPRTNGGEIEFAVISDRQSEVRLRQIQLRGDPDR